MLLSTNDPSTSREQWGADEWRAYATFLEQEGRMLAKKLFNAREELYQARTNLSRRRKGAKVEPLLWLDEEPRPVGKRGRKKSDRIPAIARGALAIQEAARASGRKMTDRQAISEFFSREGKGRYRAVGGQARHITNTMVKIRRSHNNSRK